MNVYLGDAPNVLHGATTSPTLRAAASDPALLTAVSRLRPDLVIYKPVDVQVLAAFLATC